jgi:hypothetical protein
MWNDAENVIQPQTSLYLKRQYCNHIDCNCSNNENHDTTVKQPEGRCCCLQQLAMGFFQPLHNDGGSQL